MSDETGIRVTHPGWWTSGLIVVVIIGLYMSMALFSRSFTSTIPVTVSADRAGLVMEPGGKVKLRGVQVGRVESVSVGKESVTLKLHLNRDQLKQIPANVEARIRATTAFGAKYVDLVYPDSPSPKRLAAGAMVPTRDVATEVDNVFQNLMDVLHQIDPAKLNAVLTAVADGVRGQGSRIGEATTATNEVLVALNTRHPTIGRDWRALKEFSDTYSSAAADITSIMDAASTTSATVIDHASELNTLLLSTIGLSSSGVSLLEPNQDNLVRAVNGLKPTTDLLMKYNPVYTCTLVGAQFYVERSGYYMAGGNGRSAVLDDGLLFGKDPYRYPDNLPIIAAKGGPGGEPGCGKLPLVDDNFPVPYLVTNTGWGTGIDVRPNPGVGVPGWVDFFPYTRAVPEEPTVRYPGPPAPGPPNSPPYGAPLYTPDGTPAYPAAPGTPIYEGIFGTPLWPDEPSQPSEPAPPLRPSQ